jgi:HTH-type transcriptional regulator / antitoxin HipB
MKKPAVHPVLTAASLGRILQSARKSRGLNQTQLSARVGVSQARLSALEREPGTISVDQLLAMCSGLGLELSISPKDPNPAPASDW